MIQAGVPNLTGSVLCTAGTPSKALLRNPTGAFRSSIISQGYIPQNSSTSIEGIETLIFSAESGNSIFGRANTIQPPAISILPQIKY